MPIVSIITPVYNSAAYLDGTVQSVLEQSFSSWELIMVDDASTDDSLSIARLYKEQDKRISVISLKENSGAALARNRGIEAAKGRFIAFLDSDDQWLPQKLERQIAFMIDGSIAFSYSAYHKIDHEGTVIGMTGVPERVRYSDLLKMNTIGCLTSMYDTRIFGKVYMPSIRRRQDLGLWLKLLKKVSHAYGISESLAQYRVRPGSVSANKWVAAQYTWRLYRDIEKLNIFLSSYYFSHYMFNGFLRTRFPALARLFGVLQ